MKILVTTHYWWPHLGGIERVALRQAAELANRGHEVRVLTSRVGHPRQEPPARGSAASIMVTRVPAWNGLEARGVPWPVFSPSLFRHANELARWADVVVCHGHVYLPTLAALWHARQVGTPVVLVQHSPLISYRLPLLDLTQRVADATVGSWVFNRVNVILVPSSATKSYVRSITPSEVAVLPWGIDQERLCPSTSDEARAGERRRLGIPDDAIVVVAAGRLAEKNRFEMLVRAVSSASERVEGLRCFIAGRGPQFEPLRRLSSLLDGRRTTTLVGFVTDDQLVAYLQSADLAVATAGRNEGFGLFVAEALSCGVPVIAADEGGHVDLLKDGVNGWTFDGTVEGLTAALLRGCGATMAEPRAARICRVRGSVESLTWENHSDELERVLSTVVPR